MATSESIRWRSAGLALVVACLRGGNQVALKFALRALGPFSTAGARMAISAVVVGLLSRWRGIPLKPEPGEWRPLLNLTALLLVQIGLLHSGADLTSPAHAVVLMNSNPILANLIAHFFVPEDRLSTQRVVGLALAFSGLCAVFLSAPDADLASRPLLGNTLVLVAASTLATRTVYLQKLVQRIEPSKAVFWQVLLSSPVFFLAATFAGNEYRGALLWTPLAGVLYQGIAVSGLSLVLWTYLLRRHSPGSLSVFSFSIPIFGMILSAWLLSEQITPRLILGVGGVLAGIYLVTRARRLLEEEAAPTQ